MSIETNSTAPAPAQPPDSSTGTSPEAPSVNTGSGSADEARNALVEDSSQTAGLRASSCHDRSVENAQEIIKETSAKEIPAQDGKDEDSGRSPKRKVAVLIAYNGKGYFGLQICDKNTPTIEYELFKAFCKVGAIAKCNADDPRKTPISRCGRTDKGVSAARNLIMLKLIVENPNLIADVNRALPPQIRVFDIVRVPKSANARFACQSRRYTYVLPTYCFLPPHSSLPYFYEDLQPSAATSLFYLDSSDPASSPGPHAKRHTPMPAFNQSNLSAHRISPDQLARFRDILAHYEGHHAWHNFTSGKEAAGKWLGRNVFSVKVRLIARRYLTNVRSVCAWLVCASSVCNQAVCDVLVSIWSVRNWSACASYCSEPFLGPVVAEGQPPLEFVSVSLHGEGFLLHQIRKMISLGIFLMRARTPYTALFMDLYHPEVSVNIPHAPELGLWMEEPLFDGYNAAGNSRRTAGNKDPITFAPHEKEIVAFCEANIRSPILDRESREFVYAEWLKHVECFATCYEPYLNKQGRVPAAHWTRKAKRERTDQEAAPVKVAKIAARDEAEPRSGAAQVETLEAGNATAEPAAEQLLEQSPESAVVPAAEPQPLDPPHLDGADVPPLR